MVHLLSVFPVMPCSRLSVPPLWEHTLYAQLPGSATCSRIQSFQHLVIRVCGDSVRWMNSIVNALGSSSCPSAHMNGVWIHMAATSLTMQRLALDLGINLLTSLCSSIFAILIFPDPAVSCAVSKHNKEGLSANITNSSLRGDDELDCDVAHHSHVSARFFPSLPFTCESLGTSCFASHRRSDVLIEVCVLVCVCLSVCLCGVCLCFLASAPLADGEPCLRWAHSQEKVWYTIPFRMLWCL